MPEGDMGFEGDGGGGKDHGGGGTSGVESITLPGASPEELQSTGQAGNCAEAIKALQQQWQTERARAEQAEQAALDFRTRLREAESALAQSREALDAAERRHQIDLLLIEQETVDLESSRLLTELALTQMPERDVAMAVGDLRRRKPFLFRSRRHTGAGAAMSAASARSPSEQAATEAARSGDRGALLRYLRARRGE